MTDKTQLFYFSFFFFFFSFLTDHAAEGVLSLQTELLLDNLPWHPIACHTRLWCSFVAAHLKAYYVLSLAKLLFWKSSSILLCFPVQIHTKKAISRHTVILHVPSRRIVKRNLKLAHVKRRSPCNAIFHLHHPLGWTMLAGLIAFLQLEAML